MKKSFKVLSLAVLLSTLVVGCHNNDDTSNISPSSSSITNPSSNNDNSSSNTNSSSEVTTKSVISISVGTYPSSDSVKSVDEVDLTYVTIVVNYSDESQEEIPVTSDMISWGEINNGQVTAIITYKGQSTSFYVNIEEEVIKTDLQYSFSFENGATFTYDGTGEEPNIKVNILTEGAVLGVDYEWYFSYDDDTGTHQIGQIIPTDEGTYSLSIKVEGSNKYNDLRDFRWFRITHKQVPTIQFSFDNGASFAYDGTGDAPDFSVTVPDGVTYKTYFEEDGTNIGTDIPTTPGTYSFICETEENDTYLAERQWRWFRITTPTSGGATNLVDLEYEFTFENGATFNYDGTGEEPNIKVNILTEGAVLDVDYTWYFSYDDDTGTHEIGQTIPTTPGTYGLTIKVSGSDKYNELRDFRWFRITNTQKVNPTIEFTINNGDTFAYDGTGDAPIFGVIVPDGVTYKTYFEQNETNIGTDIPTTPGTYSFICETEENDNYLATRQWRWFKITSPSLVDPIITFGEDTTFTYDGNPHTPTFTVSNGATYSIRYDSNDTFYSYDAPTEVGTYALVITVSEGNGFNASTKWVVFHIVTPQTESLSLKNHLPR